MFRTKTALGIDISGGKISLAVLRQDENGIGLVKAASGPVPAGAVDDGTIKDPLILAKGIKELKARNGIYASKAAVSLFTQPVLMQIMDVPGQTPANIRQFVQKEVKHCVALSGRDIALDFCGIGSTGRPGNKLFVVATDGRNVDEIAKACRQARIGVAAIEPPLLAYSRAFYDKKIAGKFDCNVLMAVLKDGTLTLCVFKKQSLDFVRTKNIGKEKVEPDKLCQWLAEQINAVIQFYDVEVPDSSREWEITVVADYVQLPEGAEESLKAQVTRASVQLRTAADACRDIAVEQNGNFENLSPVSIGLAMKLLGKNNNLRINLLPSETAEVKSLKKDALIAGNIAAVIVLLMMLAVGGVALMTEKTNKNIVHMKQTKLLKNTYALLREQRFIDARIKRLSDMPDRLEEILSSHNDIGWPGLLNDIRNGTPGTLRITSLLSKGNSRMSLQGTALSYEAVRLFVNMLNRSEHIGSASLTEAEKDDTESGRLVRYAINCSLTPQKRDTADVN